MPTASQELPDSQALAYRRHGPYSDPQAHAALFDGLSRDLPGLCRSVQGLLIHDHFGGLLYGPPPPGLETASRATLPVAQRLAAILRDERGPLTVARPPFARAVGTCRDFALLLCAMLRQQGVAARVRCGFAAYFHPPTFEDHWVCEYWLDDERRWALADAQLDAAHRRHLAIDFDSCDLPGEQFVFPWQAWRACRAGAADPADFGHGDDRGAWFLQVNLARDLLTLGKREVSDWDGWRAASQSQRVLLPDALAPESLAFCDDMAALAEAEQGLAPPTAEDAALRGFLAVSPWSGR